MPIDFHLSGHLCKIPFIYGEGVMEGVTVCKYDDFCLFVAKLKEDSGD